MNQSVTHIYPAPRPGKSRQLAQFDERTRAVLAMGGNAKSTQRPDIGVLNTRERIGRLLGSDFYLEGAP